MCVFMCVCVWGGVVWYIVYLPTYLSVSVNLVPGTWLVCSIDPFGLIFSHGQSVINQPCLPCLNNSQTIRETRYLGRTLTVVAFLQIHLGADLLDATPVIRRTVEAWTIAFGSFAIYKECEMYFGMPRGVFSKLSYLSGMFKRRFGGKKAIKKESTADSSQAPEQSKIERAGGDDGGDDGDACQLALVAVKEQADVASSSPLPNGQEYGEEASAAEADQDKELTEPGHVAVDVAKPLSDTPSPQDLADLSACLAKVGEEEAVSQNKVVHCVDRIVATETDNETIEQRTARNKSPRNKSPRERLLPSSWHGANKKKNKKGGGGSRNDSKRFSSSRRVFLLPGNGEVAIGNELMQRETNDLLRQTFGELERELAQVKAEVNSLTTSSDEKGQGAPESATEVSPRSLATVEALDRWGSKLHTLRESFSSRELGVQSPTSTPRGRPGSSGSGDTNVGSVGGGVSRVEAEPLNGTVVQH
jgi:hypothetical protein